MITPFNPIQNEGEGTGGGGGEEEVKKAPLLVFPLQLLETKELASKTFWLLNLTLLPYWCKISSSSLVSVPNY